MWCSLARAAVSVALRHERVAPTLLFADCREGQSRLNRNHGLFLPGCHRHACASSGTDAGPIAAPLPPPANAPINAPAAAPPPIFVALLLVWPLTLDRVGMGSDRNHPPIDLYAVKRNVNSPGACSRPLDLAEVTLPRTERRSGPGSCHSPPEGEPVWHRICRQLWPCRTDLRTHRTVSRVPGGNGLRCRGQRHQHQ